MATNKSPLLKSMFKLGRLDELIDMMTRPEALSYDFGENPSTENIPAKKCTPCGQLVIWYFVGKHHAEAQMYKTDVYKDLTKDNVSSDIVKMLKTIIVTAEVDMGWRISRLMFVIDTKLTIFFNGKTFEISSEDSKADNEYDDYLEAVKKGYAYTGDDGSWAD